MNPAPDREAIKAEIERQRAVANAAGKGAEFAAAEAEFNKFSAEEQAAHLAAQVEAPAAMNPAPVPTPQAPAADPNAPLTQGTWGMGTVGPSMSNPGGNYTPNRPASPVMDMGRNIARSVAGADAQAATEVTPAALTASTDPAVMAQLQREAYPFAGSGPGLIQATSTAQGQSSTSGKTQLDPKAVAMAKKLGLTADEMAKYGLAGAQDAEKHQYDSLQEIQQNEMKAIQEFKKDSDAIQANYDKEKDVQSEKLKSIQRAMELMPHAPRTISDKLAKDGTWDQVRYALGAMFSVAGSAFLRDGGESTRKFMGIVQGNIDRKVKEEEDQYAKYGDQARMVDNMFARLRLNNVDDKTALGVVKAMYYDAAINATKQIATQYKIDMQAPQFQSLLETLERRKAEETLKTAANLQQQSTQSSQVTTQPMATPGSGGGAEALNKDVTAFGEDFEKRGGNMGERAVSLYQQAMDSMRKAGFANDENFWRLFVGMHSGDGKGGGEMKQAAVLATLSGEKRKAMQLLIQAGAEVLKDSSGKSVTVNELAREILKSGGYSIDSIMQVRDMLLNNRRQIAEATAATHGGLPTLTAYEARKRQTSASGRAAGIGAPPKQAVDKEDVAAQPKGKLN